MGPEKNPEAYKLAEKALARITEEHRALEAAASTLAELSSAMEQYPVQAPVVEPTLLSKIFALGKINVDPLGVAGPNPMSYVDWGSQGDVIINALVCPAHDTFFDIASGYEIASRVLLLQPPKDKYPSTSTEEEDGLEFFGINLFVKPKEEDKIEPKAEDPTTLDNEKAKEKLLEAIERSEKKDLIIIKGEPVTGETNIFAVRHKKHGIVKFYAVAVKSANESIATFNQRGIFETKVERNGDNTVTVEIPNSLVAEITHITTSNPAYSDILNEFSSSKMSLEVQRVVDNTKLLNPEEIAAVRKSLSSGDKAIDVYKQFIEQPGNVSL